MPRLQPRSSSPAVDHLRLIHVVDVRGVLALPVRRVGDALGIQTAIYSSPSAARLLLSPEARGCLIVDVDGQDSDALGPGCELQIPAVAVGEAAHEWAGLASFESGFIDVVCRPLEAAKLAHAVTRALQWDLQSWEARRATDSYASRLESLSPRERQVLSALVEGHSNKEIAARLEISPKTVEFYRARVMTKMNAGSFAELVARFAARVGMAGIHFRRDAR